MLDCHAISFVVMQLVQASVLYYVCLASCCICCVCVQIALMSVDCVWCGWVDDLCLFDHVCCVYCLWTHTRARTWCRKTI